MAKRYESKMFGLDVIHRHDYEDEEIKNKINSYREESVKSLTEFLTNVPGSQNFTSFLDVGCGDFHDLILFNLLNPGYTDIRGVDLYIKEDVTRKNLKIYKKDWNNLNIFKFFSNVIFINHSLEHSANIYKMMFNISSLQRRGDVIFIAVPDGNSPFGYSITSSTTHFSVITEGFLNTLLQRFGYNVAVEKREFREGSPELWAYGIKS